MNNTSFVYIWIHGLSQMWYIGSRTAKNSSINDGYICSSKRVKAMIKNKSIEWKRFIISTGTPTNMITLENSLLIFLNAKNNPKSFNLHNGDGKFTFAGSFHTIETKLKIAEYGRNISSEKRKHLAELKRNRVVTEETKKKMSVIMTGKVRNSFSEETIKKMSEAKLGKTRPAHSKETKAKMSMSQKGRIVTEETRNKISKTIREKQAIKQAINTMDTGVTPSSLQ